MRNCKVNDRVMFTVRIDGQYAMIHAGIVTALDDIATWVQYTEAGSIKSVRVDDPDDVELLTACEHHGDIYGADDDVL